MYIVGDIQDCHWRRGKTAGRQSDGRVNHNQNKPTTHDQGQNSHKELGANNIDFQM